MTAQSDGSPPAGAAEQHVGLPAAEVLFAVAVIAAIAFQLFVPPIVGIADNADYGRIMGRLGITPDVETRSDRYFGWLVRRYHIDSHSLWPYGPASTQIVLVQLAVAASRLVTRDPVIDIRAVGAVNALFYIGSLLLIARASRGLPRLPRLLLLALLFLAASDVAYVCFFNSFYSEPAALIGLTGSIGFALLAGARPRIALPGFLLSSALLVFAKPQYAFLSLPLAVVAVFIGRGIPQRRWLLGAVVGATALVAGSALYFLEAPIPLRRAYLYDLVFYEILPRSPAPVQDLDELGLDRQLLSYFGTVAYQRDALRDPDLKSLFYPHISLGKIARFYMRHPMRFLQLLERSSRSAFRMRPMNLGNFEKSTGRPAASKSRTFALWSDFKARFLPGSGWFLLAFLAGNIALAVVVRRTFAPPDTLIALWCCVLAVATIQFLICGGGEGNYELIRHLYLFQAAFDTLFIGDLVALASLATRHRTVATAALAHS